MKIQKISLDIDDDDAIDIGLISLLKPLPEHEFFYQLNQNNAFQFSRIEDIKISGKYYEYHFLRFQAYHHLSKSCIKIIKNQSIEAIQKKVPNELFTNENNINYLLKNNTNFDYILISDDDINDFSLILPPEIALPIEHFS